MPLTIAVCVKSVVTAAPAEGPGPTVARSVENSAMNPFDRVALELACQLRDAFGGSVAAISMGPAPARFSLATALAAGADRAALLSDPLLAGGDTLATSRTLAAGVRRLGPFDLVMLGARSSDSDSGQVGAQTAQILGLPFVSQAVALAAAEGGLTVTRRADGFVEVFAVSLPAAVSVHPRAAEPRDLPLSCIAAAFEQKPVEVLSAADLGLDPGEVGLAGSPTRVVSMTRAAKKRRCEFLEGSSDAVAEDLVARWTAKGYI